MMLTDRVRLFLSEILNTRNDAYTGVPVSWRLMKGGVIVTDFKGKDIRLSPTQFIRDQHTDPYIPETSVAAGIGVGLESQEAIEIVAAAQNEEGWYDIRLRDLLLSCTVGRDERPGEEARLVLLQPCF